MINNMNKYQDHNEINFYLASFFNFILFMQVLKMFLSSKTITEINMYRMTESDV